MHVIVIAAQKGGVGKTTLTANIVKALQEVHSSKPQEHRPRGLVIDLDPQAGVTRRLIGEKLPDRGGYDVYIKGADAIESVYPVAENLDILTADGRLYEIHRDLSLQAIIPAKLTNILLDLGPKGENHYQYVFIDTPGDFNWSTLCAMILGTAFIYPAVPDDHPRHSLGVTIKASRRNDLVLNRDSPDWIVFNAVNNTTHHRLNMAGITENYSSEDWLRDHLDIRNARPVSIFKQPIKDRIKIRSSGTVVKDHPKSEETQWFRELALEIDRTLFTLKP